MVLAEILFWISAFIIFWAMIGYPLSILLLDKVYENKSEERDYSQDYSVTIMIVAHNEEEVIKEKLENVINLNYPKEKLEILVASDNSTDNTNQIVTQFIERNPSYDVRLYEAEKRMGKTNAQNEAQKTVSSEILVMTDANSILDNNSIKELTASFTSNDIAYVTGRLVYENPEGTDTSTSETNYWNLDIKIRDVESRIQTITAGNGALYACRNKDYVDFNPIKSHDSSMPIYFGLKNRRAIMNADAVVYEKAGETQEDEFGRKVRMNRVLLDHIIPDFKIFNVFKYKWFSYFYFGHRTCRYLLWLAHTVLFISNIFLLYASIFYLVILFLQCIFYLIAVIKQITRFDNKILNMVNYYVITILAQYIGIYNTITGKSKPFWEKAESTR